MEFWAGILFSGGVFVFTLLQVDVSMYPEEFQEANKICEKNKGLEKIVWEAMDGYKVICVDGARFFRSGLMKRGVQDE